MSEFHKGQRIRVTAEYATLDGEMKPELEKWVGLEGTVLHPRDWDGGYDDVSLDNPPEDVAPFPFRFLKGELEAIEPGEAAS
jgi:hypothetical protein